VDGADTYTAYKYVVDQFAYPILLTSYSGGDVFKVRAKYLWFNSPAKDYTVKIYSKQALEVKDTTGSTNIVHMDGQYPSGFTDSTFRGMNPEDNDYPTDPVDPDAPTSLTDLFALAFTDGISIFAFLAVCFSYPAVCFNPANWL